MNSPLASPLSASPVPQRYLGRLLTLLGLACIALASSSNTSAADPPRTFINPILASGADPWVIQHQGAYYLCQSRRGGIWIARSTKLSELDQATWKRVWTPPPDQPWSRELWAPELHDLRGQWYIYVAADDGDNANHRMYVLQGTSRDPQDPFEFRGQITDPTDRWAIDGTVLAMPDQRLYFIWSGWEGTNNVAQNLYIAPMDDPLTINGNRSLISRPELDWELNGRPLINEGPEVLWHNNRLFLIYSASGSWTDDYCLGQLRWTGGDVLDPSSWDKHPRAVFSRTEDVFGPGHCSFVQSPDGTENWIVYHAAKYSGAGWNRNVRAQPFTWHDDGSPNFGSPVSPGQLLPVPSGE